MPKSPAASNLPAPDVIEASVRKMAKELIDNAEAMLGAQGLGVGALVRCDAWGKYRGHYRITKISWGSMASRPHLWFYGTKLRADGSYGTHEHSICGAEGLTVIEPPPAATARQAAAAGI